MFYLDFLAGLHEALSPRTYLEIGVRTGDSLSLCRCPSVGVDPALDISHGLRDDAVLHQCTSDDYFATLGSGRPFGQLPIDFAFIDGLHLVEFALRDYLNVERFSEWSSVIVVDDVYPRNADEAARHRHTQAWTGDVFKVMYLLEDHCRDLVLVRVDTQPTGLLLVFCPNPNRTWTPLLEAVTSAVTPDPQVVPSDILTRKGARSPESVLASDIWGVLAAGRTTIGPEAGRALVLNALGTAEERFGPDRSG